MATQVQWRGGSTAEHATFTGAAREVTVDTQKQTLVVHDGSTAGGEALLREDQANLPGSVTNGIYTPGTNQVAVATNGTGRLFVDASGNVGVNEGTPLYPLVVRSAGTCVQQYKRGTTVLGYIGEADSILAGGLTTDLAIKADGNLVFGAGSLSERLRITSAGLVGIGTSSPEADLHINDAAGLARLRFTGGAVGADNFEIGQAIVGVSNSGFSIYDVDEAATRFVIDSSGRVGIGTTTVNRQLVLNDDGLACLALQNSTTGNNTTDGFQIQLSGTEAYVWNYETAPIAFGTNNAERARIDSSGRLLVGTSSGRAVGFSSLQAPVQVETTTAAAYTAVNHTNGANGCYVSIAKTRGTSAGAVTAVQNNDELGAIRISGSDGTGFVVGAQIIAEVDGTPGTNDLPTRLMFSTTADGGSSPTERMRIASNGQIGSFAADGSPSYTIRNATGAGTATVFIQGLYSATGTTSGGTASVYVFTNGNIQNTNNSYGAISDIKLKENIVDANSQWDDLKALQVRNYNFKEGQTHTQIGLVAQEAELVSPGLVSESPDRDEDGNDFGTVTKSVNYSVLYMKAVKALQEAMERIETLEAKVAALETP
jgi:hypothetical protein